MSDTIEIKYVGPDTEGVTLVAKTGSYDGQTYDCPHGEWVTLPADLVNGTDHTYDVDYTVPADPSDVSSDQIVEHGISALTAQTYVDPDGNVKSCWETRAAPKSKKLDAPTNEGLTNADV